MRKPAEKGKYTRTTKAVSVLILFAFLALLIAAFLVTNPQVLARGLELLLGKVTERGVEIGSAHLGLTPRLNLTAHNLTIKDRNDGKMFYARQIRLESNLRELLKKNVLLDKVELRGFRVAGILDSRGDLNVLAFLREFQGEDQGEKEDGNSGWTVQLIRLILRSGSVSYGKRGQADTSTLWTLEKIDGKLAIRENDLEVDSLNCSFKEATVSIGGTIAKCFTGSPEFSLRAKGQIPIKVLEGLLPEQTPQSFIQSDMQVSLLVTGLLSHLSIDTKLRVSPPTDTEEDAFLPLTISAKSLLEERDQLTLQPLTVEFPLGKVVLEGVIGNLRPSSRDFELRWNATLASEVLHHVYNNQADTAGTITTTGHATGTMEAFTATAAFDLSSLSLSSPHFITKPEQGIQSISATLSKKGSDLELPSLTAVFSESAVELNASVRNLLLPEKTFEISATGSLSLPEVVKIFPSLMQDGPDVGGETPFSLSARGSLDDRGVLNIAEAFLEALGSKMSVTGPITNAFSEGRELALWVRVSPNVQEILSHISLEDSEGFNLAFLPPFSLTLKGPLDNLHLTGDFNLKGLDGTLPYLDTRGPLKDGTAHLQVVLAREKGVDVEEFTITMWDSHVSARGTIQTNLTQDPYIDMEVEGVLETDRFFPWVSGQLPEGVRVEGPMLFTLSFDGNLASFTLDADANLTEMYWEEPYLISKAKGLNNRLTLTLRKDEGAPIACEPCAVALESARAMLSFTRLEGNEGLWSFDLETTPIELSRMQSFKRHGDRPSAQGKILIDMNALLNFSRPRESALAGFVELRDILLSTIGEKSFLDARLEAQGDYLEVPLLALKHGDSDLNFEGNLSWGSAPRLEGRLTSECFDLDDVLPAEAEEEPTAEEPKTEEQKTEEPSEADSSSRREIWPSALEDRPVVDAYVDIDNLKAGLQDLHDVSLELTGREGHYGFEGTFTTSEGSCDIRTFVSTAPDGSVKQTCQFSVENLDMRELGRQWQWKDAPITGTVNLHGYLHHTSIPGEAWINPESLNGDVKMRFEDGELRQLGLIRNVLGLMSLPVTPMLIPGLREIFLFDEAVQLAKTRGRKLRLSTLPYNLLGGEFSIVDGVATTEDLLLMSDILTLAAVMSIDFTDQTLDGLIAARPFGATRSLLLKMPVLGKAVANVTSRLLNTYFTVGGQLGKPEVKVVPLRGAGQRTRETFGRLGKRIKPQ